MVDLHRLASPALVNHVIGQVESHFGESFPRIGDDLEHDLLTKFGITYTAPCDARATGLPSVLH